MSAFFGVPVGSRYQAFRSFASYNDQAMGVNSTSYSFAAAALGCHLDLSLFPATHFRLLLRGSSNEAAQTITADLCDFADSAPARTGSDDLVITNSNGTFDSGWLQRNDSKTGLIYYSLQLKGSNATVDLNVRWLEIHWRVD